MTQGIAKIHRYALDNARNQVVVNASGREVRVVDASDANAEIQIALQDTQGDLGFFSVKKDGKIGDGQGFTKFYIRNTAQAGAWVKLIVTDGDNDFYVENTSLGQIDEITEPVTVLGGEVLKVDDDETQVLLGDVKTLLGSLDTTISGLLTLMQNDEDQRNGLTTVDNATYATVSNSTLTLVSAAANTNGVIIRLLSGYSYGATVYGTLLVDGNPLTMIDSFNTSHTVRERDIFIPSGVKVELKSTATNIQPVVWYEVL